MQLTHTLSADAALTGYGPTTLIINPSAINVPAGNLLMSLEYNWGADKIIVNRKFTEVTVDSTVAFPSDPSDPRNIVFTQEFMPGEFDRFYSIQIWAKYSAILGKQLIATITLLISQAPLIDTGTNNGFAQSIHLIANRIWDSNNQKMYVMETISPINVFVMASKT